MVIKRDKPGLDPISVPTDLDIAWAAGFYEGEGSCVRNGNGKRSFNVSVSQKDPESLYRLRDLFGGMVKEYPNDRGTNLTHGRPITISAWRICGNRARVFLACIYSYLTARRKAQVDATPARIFLDIVGDVPKIGALNFVKAKLEVHIAREHQLRSERRKKYLQDFHERNKQEDPNYMQRRRETTAKWRAEKKSKVVSIA